LKNYYHGGDDMSAEAVANIGMFFKSFPSEFTGDMYFGVGTGHAGNPFNCSSGYYDNVRIWASKTDGSGALTADQLEAVRQADLIPEPATMLILGMGGLLLTKRRKNR
jgi:hypothetical protein